MKCPPVVHARFSAVSWLIALVYSTELGQPRVVAILVANVLRFVLLFVAALEDSTSTVALMEVITPDFALTPKLKMTVMRVDSRLYKKCIH
ncbi:hypothetical protein LSAT2_026437 [Lamellibrachia satsuma]|nr:hypothetical protein LSAT2_026437 [Lamellibrachia satsuma]